MVAPLGLREQVVELIDREGRNAQAGRPSRIIVKMNALVEPTVIDALYRHPARAWSIELVIRGNCSLRPGIPGLSETIRVTSVVDKFLEHSRAFYFENGGDPDVLLGSADWMPRNFFRRIEVMFPVEDGRLREPAHRRDPSGCVKRQRQGPATQFRRDLQPVGAGRGRGRGSLPADLSDSRARVRRRSG